CHACPEFYMPNISPYENRASRTQHVASSREHLVPLSVLATQRGGPMNCPPGHVTIDPIASEDKNVASADSDRGDALFRPCPPRGRGAAGNRRGQPHPGRRQRSARRLDARTGAKRAGLSQ